jgi:hypothetical protein
MNTVLMCSLPTSHEAVAIMDALKAAGIPPEHVSLITNRNPGKVPPFSEGNRSLTASPLIDALVSGVIGAGIGVYVCAICRLLPELEPFKAYDPMSIIEGTTVVGAILGGTLSLVMRMSGHSVQSTADEGQTEGYIVALHPADERESEIAHEVVVASGNSDVVQETEPGND